MTEREQNKEDSIANQEIELSIDIEGLSIDSKEFQSIACDFSNSLDSVGVNYTSTHYVFDSVDGDGGLEGMFTILKDSLPQIAAILVAWLHGHYGRKIKVKLKDVELEAKNPQEIEKLLEMVKKYQNYPPYK